MTRRAAYSVRLPDGSLLTASEREYEALCLAAAGLSIGEMATAMGIGRATVSSYVYRWTVHAGVSGRAMLAAWALMTGAVPGERIWELWALYAPSVAAWQRVTLERT